MENGPDLSALLSTVAQNPQFLSMASSLFEKMSSAEEDGKAEQKGNEGGSGLDLSSALSLLGSAPSANGEKDQGTSNANRRALLCALKPYLSQRRRALIDGILQLEGMAGAFDAVNRMTK